MAGPDNFRRSWFHSRDYGLIVANPFGRKAMTGPDDNDVEPDITPIEPGDDFKLRFGVYLFTLSADEKPDLGALYAEYLRTAQP
jgi:hypothetical protein